jgi:hypothetical protein
MPLTGPTMTPTVVIPPFNETVTKTLRLRPMAEVTRFGYALELLTEVALTVRSKAVAGYSIGAAAAAYAVTGNAAGMAKVVSLLASAGTFTVTANDASLSIPRVMVASVGTFAITGIDATLYAKLLMAANGTFTITGNAAALTGPPISARYWRISSVSVPGSFLEISELQFFKDTTQRTGTLTSSSAPTLALSNLNDGSLSTRCYWTSSVAENAAFWVQIDLSTAQSVNGIKQGGFDNNTRYMDAVTLQYSSDGSSWTAYGSASGLSYPGNNTLSSLISFA